MKDQTTSDHYLNALFSVGGEDPTTGKKILQDNDFDEDVEYAFKEAYEKGEFIGFHMENIKLIQNNQGLIEEVEAPVEAPVEVTNLNDWIAHLKRHAVVTKENIMETLTFLSTYT